MRHRISPFHLVAALSSGVPAALSAQTAVGARPVVDAPHAVRLTGTGPAHGSRPGAAAPWAPTVAPEPADHATPGIPAPLVPRALSGGRALDAAPDALPEARAGRSAPAPRATRRATGPTRWRAIGWGAAAGALAGTLSGVAVLAACDTYCARGRGEGMALHIGVGTVVGAGIGALVHQIRR
jgi:hypothetical protein